MMMMIAATMAKTIDENLDGLGLLTTVLDEANAILP